MNTYVDIRFKGKGFSPTKLGELTKLPIEVLVESGDIGKIGRYKGKPSPYGIGLLKVDSLDNDKLIGYCNILIKKKEFLKVTNVEEIVFDIETSSKNLASFTINSDLNRLLVLLNARLEFNQIEDDKDFYFLINILNAQISASGMPNKAIVSRLLNSINQNTHLGDRITARQTYGLIMYLLRNINKGTNERIESLDKSIKEFNKIE